MSHVDLEPAYLLHLRPYRDTSVLVELLTQEWGRIGAVMRGVRGGGKRANQRRALLQPFTPLLVSWSGRGELRTLLDCDGRAGLPLGGQHLYAGLYVNELTMRLLHRDDPYPELFDRYQRCLAGLCESAAMEPLLRSYELYLLEALGYGLVLDSDAGSGLPLSPDSWYRYQPELGLVACNADELQAGALAYRGCDLLAICAGEWHEPALKCAKRLCREALQPLLGTEPLRSRELFAGKMQ